MQKRLNQPINQRIGIALHRGSTASILGKDKSKRFLQHQKVSVERHSKSPNRNNTNTDGRRRSTISSSSENLEQRHKKRDELRQDINHKLELKAMMERSAKENLETHPNTYRALSKSVVDSITSLCTSLKVNTPTKYRAIELYDRFVIRFNDEMNHSTITMSISEKESVKQRIESQGPLRMCTCILLASKLHSDTQTPTVTTLKIKELLGKSGYCFKKEAVVKSEVRVMITLNSRLHWVTTFELVEQMLTLLKLTESVLHDVYRHCMLFLEICYQFHLDLYKKLWHTKRPSKRKSSPEDADATTPNRLIKAQFKQEFEYNIALRSASIVSCALLLVDPGTDMRLFCKELAQITSLCEKDIYDLATLMFSLVFP